MSTGSTGYRWRVFLSSTFREAEAYRRAVMEQCQQHLSERIDIVALDKSEYSRISIDPEVVSVKNVTPCDLVLLLMGHELGSRSRQGESFTEAEFRTARENGIPVIAFLLDEGAQSLGPGPAAEPGPGDTQHGDRERQRQFREDVGAYATIVGQPRVPLGTTDQLADEVVKKLNEWLELHARPHSLARTGHPDTIFVGRDEPYRLLKKRVLEGLTSVVSGPSGAGKSTLVEAVCGDLDVACEFPRPAVTEPVDLDLAKAAVPFDRAATGLTEDAPPGTRHLLIVPISSVLDPRKDLEQAVADFIASFPAEDLLARRCTIIFELTDASAAEKICHYLGLNGARAHIRLQGLGPEASLALLWVNKGLHEDCPTCAKYGPRVAAAAGYWPPLLDICARSFAEYGSRNEQHEHMRHADEALKALRPGQDPMYGTFRRELESLAPDPRRLLDAAGVLLPEPFGFSPDLIAKVAGLGKPAARRALKTLVDRGYIEPAVARQGAEEDTEPEYFIHSFSWAFLQRSQGSAPSADGAAEETKRLRRIAFDWLEEQVNDTVDDELTYGGWSKLEKPERQALLANWIYQLAHADDRRKSAEALARVYLKALWWWGAYLPFDFCDLLIGLGYKAVDWSSPTVDDEDDEDDDLHEIVRSLDGLHDGYLRLGQLFDAPPRPTAAKTAWDKTGQALREIARRLQIPVDDEVKAVRHWVPVAVQADADAQEKDEAQKKADRLRDIAIFLHAFIADCEQCFYGEEDIDDRRLAEIERHLESAFAISRKRGDKWNQPWFRFLLGDAELAAAQARSGSPAGYRRQEAVCVRKARTCAEKALAGARKLGEADIGDLDFEVLACSERLLGDVDWHLGNRPDAIEHYARAVHYAHCFELWPDHQPDLYTWTFEREQRLCAVRPLGELADESGGDEALRALTARSARFFGGDPVSASERALAQIMPPASSEPAEGWAEALASALFLPYRLPSHEDLPRKDNRARQTIEQFHVDARRMIRSVEESHPDLVRLPAPP
jgi:Domain of unknown function (DUF4062)